MKRGIFILIATVLSSTVINAQEVQFKKRGDDFIKIMTTPTKVVIPWQPTTEFSLMYDDFFEIGSSKTNVQYSIILSFYSAKSNLSFKEDSKVLIRTGLDETIVLANKYGNNSIRIYGTDGVSDIIYISAGSDTHKYSLKLNITEDDLDKIITSGISTLRIQTSANNIDCALPEEKTISLATYFSKAKQSINESLNPLSTF